MNKKINNDINDEVDDDDYAEEIKNTIRDIFDDENYDEDDFSDCIIPMEELIGWIDEFADEAIEKGYPEDVVEMKIKSLFYLMKSDTQYYFVEQRGTKYFVASHFSNDTFLTERIANILYDAAMLSNSSPTDGE